MLGVPRLSQMFHIKILPAAQQEKSFLLLKGFEHLQEVKCYISVA